MKWGGMRPVNRSFVIALTLSPLACGTTVSSTPLNGGASYQPPRPGRAVAIYASAPPNRPFREVALMRVDQTRGLNQQGTDLMLDRLREQAGAMGCDAVVLGGLGDRAGVQSGSIFDLLDPGATTLNATCIVFRDKRQAQTMVQSDGEDGEPAALGQRWDGEEPR
jgi:hypothetical protein